MNKNYIYRSILAYFQTFCNRNFGVYFSVKYTEYRGSMINVVETHYVSCNIYFFVRKEVRSE